MEKLLSPEWYVIIDRKYNKTLSDPDSKQWYVFQFPMQADNFINRRLLKKQEDSSRYLIRKLKKKPKWI